MRPATQPETLCPELPEVETSRRALEPHLVGVTILHAHILNGRLRYGFRRNSPIVRSDTPVLSVQRRALNIYCWLPDGWIIIHPGCREACGYRRKRCRRKSTTMSIW